MSWVSVLLLLLLSPCIAFKTLYYYIVFRVGACLLQSFVKICSIFSFKSLLVARTSERVSVFRLLALSQKEPDVIHYLVFAHMVLLCWKFLFSAVLERPLS